MVAQDPKKGAYTELFAGLDESITRKDNGGWGMYTIYCADVRGLMRANRSSLKSHLTANWNQCVRTFVTQRLGKCFGNGVKSKFRLFCETEL